MIAENIPEIHWRSCTASQKQEEPSDFHVCKHTNSHSVSLSPPTEVILTQNYKQASPAHWHRNLFSMGKTEFAAWFGIDKTLTNNTILSSLPPEGRLLDIRKYIIRKFLYLMRSVYSPLQMETSKKTITFQFTIKHFVLILC